MVKGGACLWGFKWAHCNWPASCMCPPSINMVTAPSFLVLSLRGQVILAKVSQRFKIFKVGIKIKLVVLCCHFLDVRLSSPVRLPGAAPQLRFHRHLGARAALCFSVVRAAAAEAEQPRRDVANRLRGQHDQQRAGAAQPDQKPHREARGPHGGHQRLREQELDHSQNKDESF